MKKKLLSAGYAAGYVLFYFVLQTVITFLAVLLHELVLIGSSDVLENRYPPEVLAEKLTEGVGEAALWGFMLSAVLAVLLLWLFFSVRGRDFARETGWNAQEPFALTAPFVLGFGIAAVCSLLLGLIGMFFSSRFPAVQEAFDAYSENMETLVSGSLIVNFLSTVVFAPLAEEVVFRGLVYTRLRRAFPKWASVVLAGIIFGLVHGNLIQILYAAPLGMLLCLVYEKYRSIWGSLALHAGFNLTGFGVSCLVGGENVYMLVGVLCFAAGLALLLFHKTDVSDGEWAETVGADIRTVPVPASVPVTVPVSASAENDPVSVSDPVPVPDPDHLPEAVPAAEEAEPEPVPDPDTVSADVSVFTDGTDGVYDADGNGQK